MKTWSEKHREPLQGTALLMTRKTCRQHSSSFSLSELVRRLGYNKLSWQRMLHDKGELLLIILIYLCKWWSWLPQHSLTSFTQLTSVHSGTQTLFICSKNIPLNYVGPKISLQIHSELFSRCAKIRHMRHLAWWVTQQINPCSSSNYCPGTNQNSKWAWSPHDSPELAMDHAYHINIPLQNFSPPYSLHSFYNKLRTVA